MSRERLSTIPLLSTLSKSYASYIHKLSLLFKMYSPINLWNTVVFRVQGLEDREKSINTMVCPRIHAEGIRYFLIAVVAVVLHYLFLANQKAISFV